MTDEYRCCVCLRMTGRPVEVTVRDMAIEGGGLRIVRYCPACWEEVKTTELRFKDIYWRGYHDGANDEHESMRGEP